jgi:hypothetical protein
MEPKQNKLEQWRNKTEREKHTIAVVGATVATSLIVFVWGYTFFIAINNSPETAKTEEYNQQFSPLASIKNLFSDTAEKIKVGAGTVKDSASVIFSGTTTTSEFNQ